jgi:hypothetical protein
LAKIKKRKMHWKPSQSAQVVGYKIYWSEGGKVDYDASSAALGNVTEVLLPDGVAGFSPGQGSVEFGITAVDELGNESDMVTFSAAYQFNVPQAPQELRMDALDDFHATDQDLDPKSESDLEPKSQPGQLYEKGVYCLEERRAQADDESPESPALEEKPLKYYGRTDQE